MFARLSAFVIWSLVAATAMFWLLRLGVTAPQAPAYAVAVARTAALHGDLSRLFGAAPVLSAAAAASPDVPSRFRLLGVMAPRAPLLEGSSDYGVALIAVDGKPPRAYSVGARVDPDLVLRSVGRRSASIG
ncbi:MAG: general secretion pathway protein C, partial [Pseudomonadota bacterium]|nr:general secretion pathway protein C [Pseudomonadota bacterium]